MSRTIFFGKADEEFKKMYDAVLESQTLAIKYLQSSILNHKSIFGKDIDTVARKYILEQGYPTIPHSLGHGIGIEVHEKPSLGPSSKDIIEQGMVFSIEPGIYVKGIGGVRIEDLVLVNNNKVELLTKSEKKLIEL